MEYMESKMQGSISENERLNLEVGRLVDQLDLNRDEFLRIIAILKSLSVPSADAMSAVEIIGICERSQQVIAQTVPVIAQRDKYKRDAERIDAMDLEAKDSRTGISFDYCRHVEDGRVVEKGFRFMRHHHLGPRCDSLREAFDKREQK